MTKDTSQSFPYFPWLLIKVEGSTARLVSRKDFLSTFDPEYIPKYTALSYCWGDTNTSKQLELTRYNYNDLCESIPLADLSNAQRNAIKVTDDLGFQYLWNDALCILQDDSTDWNRTASEMGLIYQYASLTIVSLMSNHQDEFLFPRKRTSKMPTVEIPFKSSVGWSLDGGHIAGKYNLSFGGVENKLGGSVLLDKLCDTLPSNRWITRGWTFQEQNHSLRMLFFWDGGIRFNCPYHSTPVTYAPTTTDSTIEPFYYWRKDDPGDVSGGTSENDFKKSHTVVRDIWSNAGWKKSFLYYTWLRFATDYSLRVFGTDANMFPALWATAQMYEARLKDDYLMGIWKNDLWGFLWRLGANHRSVPYTKLKDLCLDYNVPDAGAVAHMSSWSWMGKKGVKFLHQTGSLCDDLDIENLRSECGIDIKGQFKVRDGKHFMGYSNTKLGIWARRTKPDHAYWENGERGSDNEATIELMIKNTNVFCMLDSTGIEYRSNGAVNFGHKTCFMLLASASVEGATNGKRAALGLILAEADESEDDGKKTWYRCGVFVCKPIVTYTHSYGGLDIFDKCERTSLWLG